MTSIHEATETQRREHEAHKARIGRLYNGPPKPPENKSVQEIPITDERQLIAELRAEVEALKAQVWSALSPSYPKVEPEPPAEPVTPEPLTLDAIKRAVAEYYGVSQIDIVSQRRTANIVRPRQVAMYLSCRLTKRSLPFIGQHFGKRDHTTVFHAREKIKKLRTTDQDTDAELTALERKLTGGV